jgi:hypothetical protein
LREQRWGSLVGRWIVRHIRDESVKARSVRNNALVQLRAILIYHTQPNDFVAPVWCNAPLGSPAQLQMTKQCSRWSVERSSHIHCPPQTLQRSEHP